MDVLSWQLVFQVIVSIAVLFAGFLVIQRARDKRFTGYAGLRPVLVLGMVSCATLAACMWFTRPPIMQAGVIEILTSTTLLTTVTLLFGLAVKYHPAFAKWPNAAIPYLNALIGIVQAAAAGAAGFSHVSTAGYAVAGSALGGFLGLIGGACWQSIKTTLIYEVFARHPLAASGWKPVPPG